MRFITLTLLAMLSGHAVAGAQSLHNIEHIVVIYLENRSFDHLYGLFPGANGLEQAKQAAPQIDAAGKPYVTLPAVMDADNNRPDSRFPTDLPNQPFAINQYVPADQKTGDLVHRFYQNQAQINGGLNDRFAAVSDAGGLVMGYYQGDKLPLWQYAQKYTLADNFFQAAFGGSFLNHMWLICACTPRFDNAPADITIQLDANGKLRKDGQVIDGYAVNTSQPSTPPYYPNTPQHKRLPLQTMPTIGDRLTEKNIAWAWYAGGWNDALAGKNTAEFQYHHQPFGYFSQYAADTPARAKHLKDEADFMRDIEQGALPAVAFYKPVGALNEHPGYADLISGEQHIADVLAKIEASPQWKNTAVIITYDENGGFWDHVAPPVKDRWGPGTRVPAIVVSPFAKRGYVDHTEYDTTSILKLIKTRFDLKPLGSRDAQANDLSNAFEFD